VPNSAAWRHGADGEIRNPLGRRRRAHKRKAFKFFIILQLLEAPPVFRSGHAIGQNSRWPQLLCSHSCAARFRSFDVSAIYLESRRSTVAAPSFGNHGRRPSVNYCAFAPRDFIGSPRNGLQLSLQLPAPRKAFICAKGWPEHPASP